MRVKSIYLASYFSSACIYLYFYLLECPQIFQDIVLYHGISILTVSMIFVKMTKFKENYFQFKYTNISTC